MKQLYINTQGAITKIFTKKTITINTTEYHMKQLYMSTQGAIPKIFTEKTKTINLIMSTNRDQ